MSEMKIIPIEGKCFGARIENVNVRSLDDAELESIRVNALAYMPKTFSKDGLRDKRSDSYPCPLHFQTPLVKKP